MRVLISKEVDLDKPVNLMDISPIDRIIYSGIDAYHRTKFYRRRIAQSEEREAEQKRKIREKFLDSLLSVIHVYIDNNKYLKEKDDKCRGILISVSAQYVPYIDDILSSKELSLYKIEHIPPTKEIQFYSKDLPHLLHIEQRGDEV